MNGECEKKVRLTVECLPAVNYALQQNHMNAVRRIAVENGTDEALENVQLRVTAEPAFAEPYTAAAACLPAGKTYEWTSVPLTLNAEFLAGLTERVNGSLTVTLSAGDEGIVYCVSPASFETAGLLWKKTVRTPCTWRWAFSGGTKRRRALSPATPRWC